MSLEGLCKFLEATGHKVLQDDNAWWYDAGMRFMISLPFDSVLDASQVGRSPSLSAYARGARFLCKEGQGRVSWTISCENRHYGLDHLSANTRSIVRRGLNNYSVGKLTPEQLQTDGLRLNIETQLRQMKKAGTRFERYWARYFSALSSVDDVHLWGAFNSDGLGAYCVAFPMGDVAHLMILRSGDNHLKTYANNALLYGYLHHVLVELGMRSVSFGWEPIQGDLPGLIKFKESMGFKRRPTCQAVAVSPKINGLIRSPIGKLVRHWPETVYSDERVSKLKGLVNWAAQSPPLILRGKA